MTKHRGFTLIEVLIVVVIIAILAALILPRLTSQTERGYIAEAQQTLGVLLRAMVKVEQTEGVQWDGNDNPIISGVQVQDDAFMGRFGLKGMASPSWSYCCNNDHCRAYRSPLSAGTCSSLVGDQIHLNTAGGYNCLGKYVRADTGTSGYGSRTGCM